jgi:hypothetical protein
MSNYGRSVLTGICLVIGYQLLVRGLGMMNRPNDVSLYVGMALVLGLVTALPPLLRTIWRRRI